MMYGLGSDASGCRVMCFLARWRLRAEGPRAIEPQDGLAARPDELLEPNAIV